MAGDKRSQRTQLVMVLRMITSIWFSIGIIFFMSQLKITRTKTEKDFQLIKSDIKSFFKKLEIQVRVLYRTCTDKFGNEGPHNLIPKKIFLIVW